MRPRLSTPFLAAYGGHISYGVRPSRRRQGHATQMLSKTLRLCAAFGLSEVLITAKAGNLASRRVIEANGGLLFGVVAYPFPSDDPRIARYRVPYPI